MAPHANNKNAEKKIHDELMEKLKLDEDREKKKLEKEAKRRAELNKITEESFARQASLLSNEKKQTIQPMKTSMKPKQNSKSSSNGKQQRKDSDNRSSQSRVYEPSTSVSKVKSSNVKEQFCNPGNKFSQSSFHENAWKKNNSRSFQSRSRYSSVSDSMWSDSDEHFPALGAAAPIPTTNVWEERKLKLNAIATLEPKNEYDEEAMLQQALVLSMLEATEEEEKRKKREEEYAMQMEALQNLPELLEDFDASDECAITGKDNFESCGNLDNFQRKEKYQAENLPLKSIPNLCEKGKVYNSGGARPKINKAIDRFGGWGLKDEKKNNKSENLSKFVDKVVSEKSLTKNRCDIITSDYQNSYESINVKENDNLNTDDPWLISGTNDAEKSSAVPESWDDEEIVYNEKGTFIDNDEDYNWDNTSDALRNDVKLPNVSPNKVLDEWLSSDNLDGCNDDESQSKKKDFTCDAQNDNNFICAPSYNDKQKYEDLKGKNVPSAVNAVSGNYDSEKILKKNLYSQDLSTNIKESGKSMWPDIVDNKQQIELPQNESDQYKCNINDQSTNNFPAFHKSAQFSSLGAHDIWSDKSENSSCFTSFLDKENLSSKSYHDSKTESSKLVNDFKSEIFDTTSSNVDTDLPPILPPKPPPTVPAMNEDNTLTTEILGADCKVEPPTLPSQPVPENPAPQFPVMSNPMFNPMLLGFNPMLMDPMLMQQMFIMSDPFLASQVLAIDQQYRMGMSVPSLMPALTVPRMMGPPLMPNAFANAMNASASWNMSQLQNELNNNQFTSVSEGGVTNCEQELSEKVSQPVGLDTAIGFNNTPSSLENGAGDPWYKGYLSSDNTSGIPPPKPPGIPPPKPPSDDVNYNNFMSVSELSKSTHCASSVNNNVIANAYFPDDSHSPTKIHESISAVEACMTKTEITGWGDNEKDSIDIPKSKVASWGDGWEDDSVSAKPVRNPSLYEEKKKTVFRQPAKQPQISRYQRNRTYN